VRENLHKDTKRKLKEQQYFELMNIHPPKDTRSPPEKFLEMKQKNKQCKNCTHELVLGVGSSWMCWDCEHNPYTKGER
tara:strand:+ start:90 stop:323 length:234 start_codon:yes stop_codon:yes gene_type:complete